jgi:hypothetical protein
LHPLLTLLVIVGTANHYWLDAGVAAALLGGVLAVVRLPHRTTTANEPSKPMAPAKAPELVGAVR